VLSSAFANDIKALLFVRDTKTCSLEYADVADYLEAFLPEGTHIQSRKPSESESARHASQHTWIVFLCRADGSCESDDEGEQPALQGGS
jgi:hypothetical protein